MITIKSKGDIQNMMLACKITANALKLAGEAVKPGVTTKQLDKIIHSYITSQGAVPSFLGLYGFPASACISVNDEVIHGIPSSRRLVSGDIVSIDVGAYYNDFHGDSAATFAVGEISEEAKSLMKATEDSLYKGIEAAKAGNRIGDISAAVEEHINSCGFAVVRQFVGHGVGRKLHEDPEVPNFGTKGKGPKLMPGMTIAIEPMVNGKGFEVKVQPDGWTVLTKSGSLSAHFEHTILITQGDAVIMTRP